MKGLLNVLKSLGTVVIWGTVGVVGLGTLGSVASSFSGDDLVVVDRVVDGDTIDVLRDGETVRVRLLNIDTPETKDPDSVVECLGPEATAFLETQLQPGDEIELVHDQERLDRYDRELAGVFKDEVLINAEIARAGLGVPVIFEPNRRFYDEVQAAFQEAESSEVGFFDPSYECTFEARLDAAEAAVSEAEEALAAAESDEVVAADLEPVEALAAAALLQAEGLVELTEVVPDSLEAAGRSAADLAGIRARAERLVDRADAVQVTVVEVREQAEEREREKARKKAEREAERKARAEREAQEKAAAEEKARKDREAERRAAEQQQAPPAPQPPPAQRPAPTPQPQPQPQPAPQPPPAPEPPSRPGAGYTGCRAYVGGPYIDDQGRRYTPIDCTTKQPITP